LRKEKEKRLQQWLVTQVCQKGDFSNNLDVPTGYFWKELLRDQGFTVGRLDSRYKGTKDAGDRSILMPN
jgi:hypothetical protein